MKTNLKIATADFPPRPLERTLPLELVRVTEAAALAAAWLVGSGDEQAADQAAVDAMRGALNDLAIDGTVVIGEGERDAAPMLYIGEKVGRGFGPSVDIALDPLEGTTITAKGGSVCWQIIMALFKTYDRCIKLRNLACRCIYF